MIARSLVAALSRDRRVIYIQFFSYLRRVKALKAIRQECGDGCKGNTSHTTHTREIYRCGCDFKGSFIVEFRIPAPQTPDPKPFV